MPLSPTEAIASCAQQSINGPRFGVGLCKQRTRMAFQVPSDGSLDATQAYHRTKLRLPLNGSEAPRGALLWWVGGSEGHGHVAIADGKGGCWSVDILKGGYWGHVGDYRTISKQWTALRFAGVSRDIDGVTVCPEPVKPASTTQAAQSSPDLSDISEGNMNFFTRFRDKYNHDEVIDLELLDRLIGSSKSAKTRTAAKACRWACTQAVRTLVKVVG